MSANRDSLQQNPFKSLATSKTHAADRLPRPLLSPFQAGSTRKPQFAASRLPSYQSQTKTRTVTVRFPKSGKVDSVSVVSACIILQGGGGRRRRSDKSRPHKKRAISGLVWEARLYQAGSKPKRFLNYRPPNWLKLPGMRTALQSFRLQHAVHPALVEPSKDTKNRLGGQWFQTPFNRQIRLSRRNFGVPHRGQRISRPRIRLRPLFRLSFSRVSACNRPSRQKLHNRRNWDTSESVTSPPFPATKFPRMSLNQVAGSCVTAQFTPEGIGSLSEGKRLRPFAG